MQNEMARLQGPSGRQEPNNNNNVILVSTRPPPPAGLNRGASDMEAKDSPGGSTNGSTDKAVTGKDKYKTLARRLKEERNQYRETCEEKQ